MIRRCSWRPWTKKGIRTVFDRQDESRAFVEISVADISIDHGCSIDTKRKQKERKKRYGRREEEKKQLNTHTCCIYGLHKRKRIYRVGTERGREREWTRRCVWGYRWQILLDGRFKMTKLIVGRKIFDLYKCSSVYIFIIKKKKRKQKRRCWVTRKKMANNGKEKRQSSYNACCDEG